MQHICNNNNEYSLSVVTLTHSKHGNEDDPLNIGVISRSECRKLCTLYKHKILYVLGFAKNCRMPHNPHKDPDT